MNDLELSIKLAKLIYPECVVYTQNSKARVQVADGDDFYFDFNNWNDLMPLVIEHKISLIAGVNFTGWIADDFDGKGKYQVENENPQRALAECLLKVLEAKGSK